MSQLDSIDLHKTLERQSSANASHVVPFPNSSRPKHLLPKAWFANGTLPKETPLGALTYTFNPGETLFLNELHYWLNKSKNYRDGRYWVYNSMETWSQRIGYSVGGFRKIVERLCTEGVLITKKMEARENWDQTLWYTIEYDKLADLFVAGLQKRNPGFDPMAKPKTSQKVVPIRSKAANDLQESTLESTSKKQPQTSLVNQFPDVVVSSNSCEEEEEELISNQQTVSSVQESSDCQAELKPTEILLEGSEREKIFRAAAELIGQDLPREMKAEMNAQSVLVCQNALAVLKEGMQARTVHNPLGFLRNAIRKKWQPQQPLRNQGSAIPQDQMDWFDAARRNNLVSAATKNGEGIWCAAGENLPWTPVSDLMGRYPQAC